MSGNSWLLYALASAFFAALTAISGKLGVAEINSNLATFIRVVIILCFTAILVTAQKSWEPLNKISTRGALLLVFSGLATGLSWLCYYRALQLGPVSRVAPVDKLSVALVMVMAVLFLGEAISWKAIIGTIMMISGALLLAL